MQKILFLSLFITLMLNFSFCHYVHAQLLINELYASPPTGEAEWLEIYNPTSQAVPLAGWQIAENISGIIKNHELINKSHDATLSAQGFWLVETSKVTLNNAGDTIYLFSPTGEIVDFITYPKLTSAQSYHRLIDGGSQWDFAQPTKGKSNHLIEYSYDDVVDNPSSISNTSQSTTTSSTTALNLTGASATNLSNSTNTNLSSKNSSSVSSQPPTDSSVTTTDNKPIVNEDASWKKGINFRLPKIKYQNDHQSLALLSVATHQSTSAASMTQAVQTSSFNRQLLIFALAVIILSTIIIISLDILQWWYDYQKNNNEEPVVEF